MSDNLCSLREIYVLGGLSDIEKQSFEMHLATCPACQDEVASLQGVADALLFDFEDMEPPAGMRNRVLNQVFDAPPEPAAVRVDSTVRMHRTYRAWLPWVSAVAVCVLVVAGAVYWTSAQNSATPFGPIEKTVALQSVHSEGTAKLWVTTGAKGSQVVIHFSHLQPVTGTEVYQVWLIQAGTSPYSAGVFTPDKDGNAVFASLMPKGDYQTVAVTLEPKAIDQKPLGKMMFQANL